MRQGAPAARTAGCRCAAGARASHPPSPPSAADAPFRQGGVTRGRKARAHGQASIKASQRWMHALQMLAPAIRGGWTRRQVCMTQAMTGEAGSARHGGGGGGRLAGVEARQVLALGVAGVLRARAVRVERAAAAALQRLAACLQQVPHTFASALESRPVVQTSFWHLQLPQPQGWPSWQTALSATRHGTSH